MELDERNLPPPPRDLLDRASLFLDFDGTLVEIAARHDAVRVESRLHQLMLRLDDCLDGRVAIVSGRSTAEVRALFGHAAFAIGGSHGLEMHWRDGRVSRGVSPRPPKIPPERVSDLKQRHPGVLIEHKPYGLALHYRLAPEAKAECAHLALELAESFGLVVQPGKMVIELKPGGADKGSAVEAFMKEAPMAQGTPIFVGDDETDEAGFAMAAQLGGAGVLVGPARVTAAAFRIDSVEHTLQWLESVCEAQR